MFGVRREAHEPLGTDGLPGAENWCVVLPQVNAVGVCLDRELGAVVEQKQRPVLGADPLEARGGGEDLRFSAMLDPQLDDVNSALEDSVEERVRTRVTHQVQAGLREPLASVVHTASLARARGH